MVGQWQIYYIGKKRPWPIFYSHSQTKQENDRKMKNNRISLTFVPDLLKTFTFLFLYINSTENGSVLDFVCPKKANVKLYTSIDSLIY